tara:strand:+ start:22178 stop:22522 length:345 start_codon:yes stop_codon:yes gene_type:complete
MAFAGAPEEGEAQFTAEHDQDWNTWLTVILQPDPRVRPIKVRKFQLSHRKKEEKRHGAADRPKSHFAFKKSEYVLPRILSSDAERWTGALPHRSRKTEPVFQYTYREYHRDITW